MTIPGEETCAFQAVLRLITATDHTDVMTGSHLQITGTIHLYNQKCNPGGRDLRREFARDEIVGWIKPDVIEVDRAVPPKFSTRTEIINILNATLPATEAGVLTGMLLGDKSAVPDDIRDDFRRSGLYHLLAVSGLHIGFLCAILLLILQIFTLNLNLRRFAMLVVIWAYVIITGANTPTLRAALMLTLVLLSFNLRRMPRLWNLWGVAAFIILLFSPHELFKPGFQLSFTAMAGVLLALDVKRRRELNWPVLLPKSRRLRASLITWIFDPLLVSICVVILTAPILIFHFGGFAPIAILLNLAAIPLAGGIFGLAWSVIVLKGLFGVSILALSSALELMLKGLESLAFYGGSMPGNAAVSQIGLFTASILVIILLGLLLSERWKARILWVFGGIVLWLLIAPFQSSSHLRIECLDVGQGDAILMRFPGGNNLLVDCGDESAARFEIVPSLRKRGITHVENLLITHFDIDHAGGAPLLLESLKVDRLILNTNSRDDPLAATILNAAEQQGVSVCTVSFGDTIAGYPGTKCLVLWPPECVGGGENRESIVLKVTYGDVDILLTGDIGFSDERYLAAGGALLQSDILKVPHHGSRYSSSAAFLGLVQPDFAFITCGKNNPFGHPAQRVISDLSALGSDIHRTDINQAGILATDGQEIWQVDWR
jgi:competence protein ComEC